jgi:hypothetical protein
LLSQQTRINPYPRWHLRFGLLNLYSICSIFASFAWFTLRNRIYYSARLRFANQVAFFGGYKSGGSRIDFGIKPKTIGQSEKSLLDEDSESRTVAIKSYPCGIIETKIFYKRTGCNCKRATLCKNMRPARGSRVIKPSSQ